VVSSYSDTHVVFGFGNYYDGTSSVGGPIILHAGDSFTIGVDGLTCSTTVPQYPGIVSCSSGGPIFLHQGGA
jgi:hypothetical protein